jgi:hypothetical protein
VGQSAVLPQYPDGFVRGYSFFETALKIVLEFHSTNISRLQRLVSLRLFGSVADFSFFLGKSD